MLQLTTVAGGGYDRGVALGRSLAPRVRGHVEAWLAALALDVPGDPERYVRTMLAETDFTTAIAAHTPDVMEEVRGLAAGAGLDPDLVFALQLIDEEWAYRVRRRGEPGGREKCSSIAMVAGPGLTWIGQNMDLGAYTDGHQALVRLEADGPTPANLLFTLAGVVVLLGVNSAGLGVCVNSLPQLPSAPQGLPVAFVIRRLLQCRSLLEAVTCIQDLPHATNQHYLLAEPGAARSFEASAAGVTEYHPPAADRIFHTNHPLTEVQGAPQTAAARENSRARLDALVGRLTTGEVGLAPIEAALCSCDDPRHPVRRERSDKGGLIGFTTGSMISALRPAGSPTESWITAGPPSVDAYECFSLEPAPVPV